MNQRSNSNKLYVYDSLKSKSKIKKKNFEMRVHLRIREKYAQSVDNWKVNIQSRGGSRIFSRGGGGFSKNFPKFWRTFFFFRSTELIFGALPKHCFAPILAKFSAPQANFWKTGEKSRFWHFLENFDKKTRFFGARSPSKLVYIGALKKIWGSVGQKWIS